MAGWALVLLTGSPGLAVEPRVLENDAVRLLAAGRCADAIATLETLSDRQRDERWFHLCATANLMCAQGNTASAFQKKAHQWLILGARRFPDAISLRVEHGQILLAEGAWKEATKTLAEAKDLLEKQLERQQDPGVQAEIRRRLRRVDSYLKKAREHNIAPS